MGWIIAIAALIAACIKYNDATVIAAGLFGIAGGLGSIASAIREQFNIKR